MRSSSPGPWRVGRRQHPLQNWRLCAHRGPHSWCHFPPTSCCMSRRRCVASPRQGTAGDGWHDESVTRTRHAAWFRRTRLGEACPLHPRTGMTLHHFTVDVEEYFQVSAFERCLRRADWGSLESRVTASVACLLDLLARHAARATFFVLGWVAQRHPELVRGLARAGHEVASHGWDHARVTEQSPLAFRESVRRTRYMLEDLIGAPVLGFRAPSFSIVPGREWALDILLEEGYRYDSSLFPVRRPGYGYPGGRDVRDPYWLDRPAGRLAELPPATLRRLGVNLPAGGGAYFRILPYALVRSAIAAYDRRGVPATFYVHPWEIDPAQPGLPVSWLAGVRHYTGLGRTLSRLERLLSEFRFTAIADRFVASAPATPSASGTPRQWRIGAGGGRGGGGGGGRGGAGRARAGVGAQQGGDA